jgi:small multidrug resistance pump
MSHWIYLSAAIISEVIGTSFLKSAEGFTRPAPSLIVVVAYVASFYFLSLALRTLPVGIAYAVWAGTGVALITLAGFAFFGEKLDAPAVIGILLIVSGVVVINVFSSSIGNSAT